MTGIGVFTSLPNATAKRARKRAPQPPPKLVSVVVPAYNEEPNLRFLHEHLSRVFDAIDDRAEFVFVDDGSTDNTRAALTQLHKDDARVKAIFLSRNFGQSAALTAGIEAAKGDAIIVMDADGQDPPEVIPSLVAKWKEGYDVVGGRRTSRRGEPVLKRAMAYVWYRLMRMLIGWDMPLDTGEFRIIDRAVADVFRACPQRHRLVRTLTSWPGFRQTTVDYEHGVRHAGATKYTYRASLRLALTSITGFSLVPLRIAFGLGAAIALCAAMACVWILGAGLRGAAINGAALSMAGLWLLGGVQCILIGILGEYVGRTYIETQHRPLYVVRDSIGLEE